MPRKTRIVSVKLPEFIEKINWELLREQKQTLINLASIRRQGISEKATKERDDLDGIINLLDELQDYAADGLGMGEKAIFGNLK